MPDRIAAVACRLAPLGSVLAAALLVLQVGSPAGGGLAPGAVPGAGSGLAPGAGGIASAPPEIAPVAPAVPPPPSQQAIPGQFGAFGPTGPGGAPLLLPRAARPATHPVPQTPSAPHG